jgi:hypothetical protein
VRFIVIILTIILVLAFTSMAAGGGYLIYKEVGPSDSSSDVEVTIDSSSLTLKLVSAAPALIIFCFGAVGLILMSFRIPTKEVLGNRTEGGGSAGTMGLMFHKKVLSTEQTNIPLPVWWLLSKSGRFEKIESNA